MASAKRVAFNVSAGIFSNVTRILIQVIMLPLMARELGPKLLGLYALALPMVNFMLVLADAGLGESLAREKTDDTIVWSSAFWGLLGSSCVLAAGVYGASFFVASLANQPQLPIITLPMALTLIMVALTVIPGALMLRSGRIAQGAMGEFVANICSAALAIYMATHGFGIWSLVAQLVCVFALRMIAFNAMFPFFPRAQFSFDSLAGHWNISGAIMGSRLLELGGRLSENTLVSRLLGPVSLGTYGYANQIGRFFSDAVGNPVWANLYYVAINAKDEEIPLHYIRFHRVVALLLFPSAVLMALAMPTIVPMLLGAKWASAIQPMMVLILTYPFLSMAGFYGAVMFARNRSRIVLGGLLGYLLARICVVVIGYKTGVLGMAIGLSIVNIGYYLWVIFFISRIIGHTVLEFVGAVIGPLAASAIIGLSALFALGNARSVSLLAVVGGLGALAYIIMLLLIDGRFKRDLTLGLRVLRRKSSG
jgi:O-antigen/teichoic acid export membrane protein